jgi:hypothetical protein
MNPQKEANMTTKFSAEEKTIIEYVESGRAISVDNVEKEKNRFTQIVRTQMCKKKSSALGYYKAILNVSKPNPLAKACLQTIIVCLTS